MNARLNHRTASWQDTPGYGDHVNTSKSFQPVVKYILAGNERYLADRMAGIENPEDGRTDVW